MKIAISASGPNLDSPFEPRFGRAAGFVIYDTETEKVEFLDNSANQGLPQGAGIQTAQKITQAGADILITGNIGPKASQALAGSSLKTFSCEAQTVSQALQCYRSGMASSTGQSPQGQSGSGMGPGRGVSGGGRGMGGGARGRGPGQGGRGMGGGGKGRGMKGGGRGMGGGGGQGMGGGQI